MITHVACYHRIGPNARLEPPCGYRKRHLGVSCLGVKLWPTRSSRHLQDVNSLVFLESVGSVMRRVADNDEACRQVDTLCKPRRAAATATTLIRGGACFRARVGAWGLYACTTREGTPQQTTAQSLGGLRRRDPSGSKQRLARPTCSWVGRFQRALVRASPSMQVEQEERAVRLASPYQARTASKREIITTKSGTGKPSKGGVACIGSGDLSKAREHGTADTRRDWPR